MNMQPIFITGIGTDVGKTLVAAILAQALEADYWKPVQAGFEQGTDSDSVKHMLGNTATRIYPECYRLARAASPHIAAREEGIRISLENIMEQYKKIERDINAGRQAPLVIEGAGGLMVPLNEGDFVLDLVRKLRARVVIVSRNYLGSINHSLLTAAVCRAQQLDTAGWVFNDQYMNYEEEIVTWTGIPSIASIPFRENPGRAFVAEQAARMRKQARQFLL